MNDRSSSFKLFFCVCVLVILKVVNNQPVSQCKYGQFMINNQCMQCLSSCAKCTSLLEPCPECTEGLKREEGYDQCVECPFGQLICQKQDAVVCQPHYNKIKNKCYPQCRVNNCYKCKSLFDNTCQECNKQYKLVKDGKECVPSKRILFDDRPITGPFSQMPQPPPLQSNTELANQLNSRFNLDLAPVAAQDSITQGQILDMTRSIATNMKIPEFDISSFPSGTQSIKKLDDIPQFFDFSKILNPPKNNSTTINTNITIKPQNSSQPSQSQTVNNTNKTQKQDDYKFQQSKQPIINKNATPIWSTQPTQQVTQNFVLPVQNFTNNSRTAVLNMTQQINNFNMSTNKTNSQIIQTNAQTSAQIIQPTTNTLPNSTVSPIIWGLPTSQVNTSKSENTNVIPLLANITTNNVNSSNLSQQCPIGQYSQKITTNQESVCSLCNPKCATCINSADQCLECSKGYIKQGWKCVKNQTVQFSFRLELKEKTMFDPKKLTQNLVQFKKQFVKKVLPSQYDKQNYSVVTLHRVIKQMKVAQGLNSSQNNINGLIIQGSIERDANITLHGLQKHLEHRIPLNRDINIFKIDDYRLFTRDQKIYNRPINKNEPSRLKKILIILIPVLVGSLLCGFAIALFYCYKRKRLCFKQNLPTMKVHEYQNQQFQVPSSERRASANKNSYQVEHVQMGNIPLAFAQGSSDVLVKNTNLSDKNSEKQSSEPSQNQNDDIKKAEKGDYRSIKVVDYGNQK